MIPQRFYTLFLLIKEGGNTVRGQFAQWIHVLISLPLLQKVLFFLMMIVVIGVGYRVLGPSMLVIQVFGFVPVLINQAAMIDIRDTKKLHAIMGPSALLIAAQKIMLGGYGYAANAILFSIRALTFSLLPDEWLDRDNRRLKLAFGFWAVGICIIGALGLYLSPWHFLPGIAMTFGVAATALSSSSDKGKDKGHWTRLLYLIANSLNAVYSAFFSHSAAGLIADLMNVRGMATGILKFDMPPQDTDGKTLPWRRRFKIYRQKFNQA